MSETTLVNFRLDQDTKRSMEGICRDLGMSMTTAFTLFAKKVDRERRIPFDVSLDGTSATGAQPLTIGSNHADPAVIVEDVTRVFGEGAILGTDYGPVPRGSGKDLITVRNLLEHKSGWENIPDDPMFSNAGATQRQIIARMLAARPLSAPAGEKYSYSNFGYLVLGRIIEKVSGMPYGKFIRRHVLRPCGIRRMRIGEAHGDKPRHDEPQYCLLPEETGQSYYLDIRRMDSHGGWIASAADVARFMARIDRNPAVRDIIPDSLASQFYFGFERWIHTGSLPGTAAVMIRIDDRYSFVLLSNKRSCDERFWDDLSQMPIHAITGR